MRDRNESTIEGCDDENGREKQESPLLHLSGSHAGYQSMATSSADIVGWTRHEELPEKSVPVNRGIG